MLRARCAAISSGTSMSAGSSASAARCAAGREMGPLSAAPDPGRVPAALLRAIPALLPDSPLRINLRALIGRGLGESCRQFRKRSFRIGAPSQLVAAHVDERQHRNRVRRRAESRGAGRSRHGRRRRLADPIPVDGEIRYEIRDCALFIPISWCRSWSTAPVRKTRSSRTSSGRCSGRACRKARHPPSSSSASSVCCRPRQRRRSDRPRAPSLGPVEPTARRCRPSGH
jgi:hypothetical protein